MEHITHSPDDTATFAARLAPLLRPGDWITLHGALGSGKTTFARGFIRALAPAQEEVVSPTFTLVQPYGIDFASGERGELWHCDFYRLEDAQEANELGLDDRADIALLIEWPDIIASRLPAERLALYIEQAPAETGDVRRIRLEPHGASWRQRLEQLALPPEPQ